MRVGRLMWPCVEVALLALVFAACGSPAPSPTPTPSQAPTPSATPALPADLARADWARFEEVRHLIAARGSAAWPGWGDDPPPLVLQLAAGAYAVGLPNPRPVNFEQVEGVTVDGLPVVHADGQIAPGIGLQFLGQTPVIVLVPRDVLQAAVDQALGPGVVAIDDVAYIRWSVHEAFHRFQLTQTGNNPPSFGFGGDEQSLLDAITNDPGATDALAAEAALLGEALDAPDADQGRALANDFLTARRTRRAALDPQVGALERSIEWLEGLARYAEVRLVQAAATDYQPSPDFSALPATYLTADQTWADATQWLTKLSDVPGGLRDRYYELGAGQAYLLDILNPGWQQRALPGRAGVEDLLAAPFSPD